MITSVIDPAIIIPASKINLRMRTLTIFKARDFADVDQEIVTSIKIMVGLVALSQDIQSTQQIDRQRILVVLNKLCNVGSPQMAPTE